jgi:hypothetical protein
MGFKQVIFYSMCGVLINYAGHARAESGAQKEIGASTDSWFALQASGAAAAPTGPMPGEQASAAYARYLKSFDKPIPDTFGSTLTDGIARVKPSGG